MTMKEGKFDTCELPVRRPKGRLKGEKNEGEEVD